MPNSLSLLVKLTENDKRLLIAIFIVFILVFVLIGYLVHLVKRIMKRQAKQVDKFMYDMVKLKIVKTTKHFRKVANKKSYRYFFKKSVIPIIFMLISSLTVLIFCLIKEINNISFLFSTENGFMSLFYTFDWKNMPKAEFFGITLPCDWPPVLNTPHFVYNDVHAWISYICVPLFSIGVIWYLINVQAFIARAYRIIKMSKDVFGKDLEKLAADNEI
jgi:hypothetical protein